MDVSTDNEQRLTEAVGQQHVSVAIEADQSTFQLHKSSVLQRHSADGLLDSEEQ